MEARNLVEQILDSSRELASRGQERLEQGLNVPGEGGERQAMLSGLGKGVAAGGLLAILLGTKVGRRIGTTGLKLGSLAALGGLAYQAFRNWQASSAADATAVQAYGARVGPSLEELPPSQIEAHSRAVLRAIIGAAKADGHIDEAEQAQIDEQLRDAGLAREDEQFVRDEVQRPLDVQEIAAAARSASAGAELYLASLVVIDADNEQERQYLRDLAEALGLEPDLVDRLEEQVT